MPSLDRLPLDPTPAVTVVPDVGDAVLGVALDVKKPKPKGGGSTGVTGDTAGTSTDED